MEFTVNQALKKAIEAHKSGQIQEADRLYTAILEAQPKHPDANHNIGVLAVGLGKVEQALPFFKTALEANASIAQFWLSYIDALIKLNKVADAKSVFEQAKSKGAKGGWVEQIAVRLENVAKIAGNQADEDILGKALELRERGKYDEAINLLLNQTKHFSANPNISAILLHCYILNDNLEQAIIYLDKAKNINPNNASVGWNETRLLLKQKKVDEALAVAQRTNKLFPDDVEGMGVLGSCLRINGNFDESIKYLNKAIELDPNYAEAFINRGLISLAQKDKVNALTDLEKAHHLKPHIKQIWHTLLNLKTEIKKFEDVIFLATQMAKLDPSDEQIIGAIALCYQHLHNYDQAVIFYNKAIALKADYLAAWTNLGSAFRQQGKLEEAVEAYNKAIFIKPDHAEAYNNLGIALQEQDKLEEAIKAYSKALSIKPDHNEAYNNTTELLKIYSPKSELSHRAVKVSDKIRVLSSHILYATSNKEIIDNLLECLNYINTEGFNYKTPLSQIYKRNDVDLNCKRHKKIFNTKHIIPKFCFGCFKVQVEVDTFVELIRLTSLFYKFDFEDDLTRKTIVELRPNIPGYYKGLVYCNGLDQAKKVKHFLDISLKEVFAAKTMSKIKRGCSEYPLKFPGYGKITEQGETMMSFPEKWKPFEEKFDQIDFVERRENQKASLPKFCLSDFHIIQKWIDYAKGIGDQSIKSFSDRPIVFRDIYEVAKIRVKS